MVFLTYSNYPYMFSNQLLSMLSVYVFAFLVGEALSTGTLYITLMVTLAKSAEKTVSKLVFRSSFGELTIGREILYESITSIIKRADGAW